LATSVKESRVPGKVVLAVTGSIAAFKAAALASDLVQAGFEVRVILSRGGERFVSRLTFEALTGSSVAQEVWEEEPGGTRMGHLELARWADILVVAPASAGALARLALGTADDMLSAVALATPAPLLLAPAMESNMWRHPATRTHVETLRERGAIFVGPESGRLASGSVGEGRMAEPGEVRHALERLLQTSRDLTGRRILVTAGPTQEPIDPVRFLGNRSSGKMGYALAEEARDRGAQVLLVSGPTALPPPPGVEIVAVETHREMRDAVLHHASDMDVVVMAAAVADFRPVAPSQGKIKRTEGLALDLLANSDIAAEASMANPSAVHVGFALESEDLVQHAREKMHRKGQDLVVANRIDDGHNPFGSDSNQVTLLTADGERALPVASKRAVARAVVDEVVRLLAEKRGRSPRGS
jgi:phosphopantothenoylcysteine decarboxylase/phosphopantothenate--cysteine ligase